MELIDGADLAQQLADRPLPVEEVLDIARQIAEAVEAAHDAGVIHRDLKPANVTLTGDGKVKVLDFGLAKALDNTATAPDANPALSPTVTSVGSAVGLILGTAAYMSPEQAKGKAVDKRADIWAFGVMLYEMLAGGRLFVGDSVPEVLGAVFRQEIDLDKLPAATPRSVRNLIGRCFGTSVKRVSHFRRTHGRTWQTNRALPQYRLRPSSAGWVGSSRFYPSSRLSRWRYVPPAMTNRQNSFASPSLKPRGRPLRSARVTRRSLPMGTRSFSSDRVRVVARDCGSNR